MLSRTRWGLKFILLAGLGLSCSVGAAAAPFANVELAGSAKQQVHLAGDLDGDGRKDDVYFVRLTGPVPSSVVVVHPFPGDLQKLVPGELALAIILHPQGKPQNYLISMNKDMFKSPTWAKGEYRGLVKLGHGPVKPKDAKGPSIGVFTESGAYEYVRWTGKTFVATSEGDEP